MKGAYILEVFKVLRKFNEEATTVPLDNIAWYNALYEGTPIESLTVVSEQKYYHTITHVLDPAPTQIPRDVITAANMIDQITLALGNPVPSPLLGYDELYHEFNIPKKSGGYRTIEAPNANLKEMQSQVIKLLQFGLHLEAHNNAFAYIAQRSPARALEVHQDFNSKWFAKFDLKDFFGSTTTKVLRDMFKRTYPLYFLPEVIQKRIFILATRHGKLPQGTPMSPLLTNLVMIPFDKAMTDYAHKNNMRYTRYADDLLFSSPKTFEHSKIEIEIKKIFKQYKMPYKVNTDKTRYGSAHGSNWNLGLMLNKDNNITLGHKRKQRLKAGVNNLLKDFTSGRRWDIIDTQILQGELSYLKSIEPDYTAFMVQRLETKYHVTLSHVMKALITGTPQPPCTPARNPTEIY